MRVRDLIDRLSALDADLPVIMPGEDYEFAEVGDAFEDLAVIVSGAEVLLADERGRGHVRVVRLFGRED